LRSHVPEPGVKVLRGTYYEIGLQIGATLGSLEVPRADEETVALALRCEALLADLYPGLVDKVEGMIDGGRLSGRDFKALFYARDVSPQMGCTNLAVLPSHSAGGSLIIGVNYDWYYAAEKWREMRKMSPEGALESLRVTHHWAGSPDGLNEEGLGVFLSVLPHREASGPGLAWHLVLDVLLDNCRDAADACDLVASVPHLGAFNYLIADAGGHAVVAEALPGHVTIREPEDGYLLATNHLPGREEPEEQLSEPDKRRQQRSLARYAWARRTLMAVGGLVDEDDIKHVLRDHEAPICRGNHRPPETSTEFDDVFGTIWSLLAKPGDGELQVAWGHPCRSDYVSHRLC
jgi:hypothetical protein